MMRITAIYFAFAVKDKFSFIIMIILKSKASNKQLYNEGSVESKTLTLYIV